MFNLITNKLHVANILGTVLTKVSCDMQISAITKARNTLIAGGGKRGNTIELIIVSCKY